MINPFGHANGSLLNGNDVNNTHPGIGVNCNRNYDAYWSQIINSGGGDHNGGYPFSEPETRWVKETVEWIGPENIHYALDLHDAPSLIHGDYWINYNTFHKVSRRETKKLLLHLAEKNIREKLGREPDLPHDKDTNTSGVFPLWAGRTKGIPASTVECCYDMQPFTAEFMTLAVEVYINAIITNALCDDHRHPVFASNEEWFDLEWYKAAIEHVQISHLSGYDSPMPYEHYPLKGRIGKWEELTTKYPKYVKAGDLALTNVAGKPLYWYTMSPKTPKKNILIVGGRMEPAKGFEPFSNAMLRFAELINESHAKDKHLTWLKKNVRFIMVPYIEFDPNYLNSYLNFAVNGTPDLSKKPVKNIVDLMAHLKTSYGSIDGVIYSTEMTAANIEAALTTDVFALSPLDSNDVLDVQSYIDYLNGRKKLNAAKSAFIATGTGEFGSYVHSLQIPCVRIDTGVDHAMFNEHKDEFDGSTGEPVTIVPVSSYLNLDPEICRRLNNMVNISKLMADK